MGILYPASSELSLCEAINGRSNVNLKSKKRSKERSSYFGDIDQREENEQKRSYLIVETVKSIILKSGPQKSLDKADENVHSGTSSLPFLVTLTQNSFSQLITLFVHTFSLLSFIKD